MRRFMLPFTGLNRGFWDKDEPVHTVGTGFWYNTYNRAAVARK